MKKFFTLFSVITMSALSCDNPTINFNIPEKIHYDTKYIPQEKIRILQDTTVQKDYPYYTEKHIEKRQRNSNFNQKHGKDTSHTQRKHNYKSKK